MTVAMTIEARWCQVVLRGWQEPVAVTVKVPEPYQAGADFDHSYGAGGHEPGPCCTTRTCGWMPRVMEIGHRIGADR